MIRHSGKRRQRMQGPQRGGHPNQRVRYWKGYSLHKIGDGDPIFDAGVPDTRRQTRFGRRLHAGEVARRIVGAHDDPQQVWGSSHDDAKDVRRSAAALGQLADVFELCDTESLVQPRVTAALFSCGIISLHWEWGWGSIL